MTPPLPSGYYSSPGRCPVCQRMLTECDQIDGEVIYSCRQKCGQQEVDEMLGMIVEGPDEDGWDGEVGRP